MKKFLFLLFMIISANVFCSEFYNYEENWYAGDEIGGVFFRKLEIKERGNDGIKCIISTAMEPLSPFVQVEVFAKKIGKTYVFSFKDCWDNFCYGAFLFENAKTVKLFIDCIFFSEHGKNASHLYGEETVLQLTNL